jgi:hypothetical protein
MHQMLAGYHLDTVHPFCPTQMPQTQQAQLEWDQPRTDTADFFLCAFHSPLVMAICRDCVWDVHAAPPQATPLHGAITHDPIQLGEGAFATVDMCEYTPGPGAARGSVDGVPAASAPAPARTGSGKPAPGSRVSSGRPSGQENGSGADAGRWPAMVAVKRLKPETQADEAELNAFLQECSLMRKLKHK